MVQNKSMPPGSVIPEVPYPDVTQGVHWLSQAFGFKERLRIGGHRVQLTFGDGSIVATSHEGEIRPRYTLMARVQDVDAHFERAKAHGARVLSPPADYPYGERQYTVEDLAGHMWTFSQSTRDVDPAEWGGELIL
ncbi:MAG: VOC family protein [Chloroflexota bacterium]